MDDEAAGTDVDNAADKLRELTLSGKYSSSYHKKLQLSRAKQNQVLSEPPPIPLILISLRV